MIPKFWEHLWTRALGCSPSSWATLKMEAVRFIESSERNISIMSQKRAILCIILSLFLGFFLFVSIYLRSSYVLDRDSSVGVATRYGLDGPGIESRWGARFSASVHTSPGAHPASHTVGTGSFPGGKAAGAWG